MPELPEVEVICRGLSPLISGKTLVNMSTSGHALRLPMPETAIRQHILGNRVIKVYRRAKYLVIELNKGALLIFHLGMTGRIGIFAKEEKRQRHDHLQLGLDNDLELRFNDTRRFGSVQVFSAVELKTKQPFANLGPEPFDRRFSANYLKKLAAKKKKPVKNFLMDNMVVVGIGNIYASETLFAARIAPLTPTGILTTEQWRKIIKESRRVLNRAIKCGGTTISDFVNTKGEAGLFQVELKVYGRKNQPCPHCKTPIERTVMAGRATFHCPVCQK